MRWNGPSELGCRNPEDLTLTSTLRVTDKGNEVSQLNELECVGQTVYANIWGSDSIIAINKSNGEVGLTIDASMLAENESDGYNDVLNGIAYVSEQDSFLVTGKNWTSMQLVSFGDTHDTQDEESLESPVISILKSIWPVLLITALVIFLSSMRLLSVIMHFIILMLVKRKTEQQTICL